MIEIVDDLLARYRAQIAGDFDGYRNHCRRMASFCQALLSDAAYDERIAIAAAFHDLGIWTARTWDYLPPSEALARAYLAASGREAWTDEIVRAIGDHHKVTPSAGGSAFVEAFRKADLVDVSLGVVRHGLASADVARIRAEYPNAGFHRCLLRLSGAALVRTPLRPMPMMKW